MTLILNNGVVNYNTVKCVTAIDEHRWVLEFNDGSQATVLGSGLNDVKAIARGAFDSSVVVELDASLELNTEED